MTRHFLRDDDLSPDEQRQVIDRAIAMKGDRFAERPLEGPQTVAVIFDKTSTRTRVSFAAGISDLGGSPLIINPGESQLGGKESVADTARVFERMLAAVVWRTFAQSGLDEMAAGTTIPVVNALSDDFHPCQLLADLVTVKEHRGELAGQKLAFFGDTASNMAHSYLLACATAGMHVVLSGPVDEAPRGDILSDAQRIAADTGGSAGFTVDAREAAADADVIVTDTWVSMGQESEKDARLRRFETYRVDAELMQQAAQDAIFLHCLPAYRGFEVTADVIDGPQSVIWDEAENRLHAQKALLAWLLEQ
ncbi:MAG TPA: ornithine carbamoyltransferase [Candidatus Agrococcus pullicola]|uniref:Ornithine carbamoyltransferase n=1 Tax=Candidatus Agrococcus pullicola TaxID=2838429 RepID=A0A9D1YYK8_9MICO|nr:ornithine carbamoyltransferase [Candidatus Agrococcus pullicola]